MDTQQSPPSNISPSRPTLHTARLTLRPIVLEDAKDIQRLAGDREIARNTMLVPHPYEDGMAEAWIEPQEDIYRKGQGVTFGIERKSDEVLIGTIGLTIHEKHHNAELGYWIGREFWGNGYCSEASRELLRYGFRTRQLHRIHAKHYTRNPASGRVMQKIGMTFEGTMREHILKWGEFEDVSIYGILEADFED